MAEPATSLALLQTQMGHETWLGILWGRSFEQVAGKRGVRFARELEIPRRFNPLKIREDIRRIRAFIKRERISVVHCHLLHDHWLAALALRGLGDDKPILVRTVHRYEQMRRDPIHKWLFCTATDLLITVSSEQQSIISTAYGEAACKIRVIPGGVNAERFHPELSGEAVRRDMGERPTAAVAGIVAHLGYHRGHDWLLAAAPKVAEACPRASMWIVGQGEIKYRLRAQVRDPKYHDRVVMAGYRDADLPETYAAIDVLLMLALGSEGSARAALEAMSSGRPVIGVRKGSLIDLIEDGVDGLLVNEGNVDELADALIRMLNDRDQMRRMGTRARQKILANYTEQRRAERTLAAYAEVAQQKH